MSGAESSNVELLFKEHSFEEIESVRDNLANEIDKRTDLLKSIVKEKYRDVVETSDAIQSIKLNLGKVEKSIQNLDESISNFYHRLNNHGEQEVTKRGLSTVQSGNNSDGLQRVDDEKVLANRLVQMTADMWEQFDSENFKRCVRLYNNSVQLLEDYKGTQSSQSEPSVNERDQLLVKLETNIQRAKDTIKNQLWYRIHSAEPNQIGIMDSGDADADHDELFKFCMQSSIGFLVEKLRNEISDNSYHAQIQRYQPYSFFNTKTNQIEAQIDDLRPPPAAGCYLQIPKHTSVEMSSFLYDVCRVINTISGFNLSKTSIVNGLRMTVEQILQVYSELLPKLDSDLKGESKRRRAMQLYFDLMHVRVLLNTSKDIELIEELDPQISQLAGKFELLLDSIELYMISDAMHTNVLQLSQSTVRLYGLLIPNLH